MKGLWNLDGDIQNVSDSTIWRAYNSHPVAPISCWNSKCSRNQPNINILHFYQSWWMQFAFIGIFSILEFVCMFSWTHPWNIYYKWFNVFIVFYAFQLPVCSGILKRFDFRDIKYTFLHTPTNSVKLAFCVCIFQLFFSFDSLVIHKLQHYLLHSWLFHILPYACNFLFCTCHTNVLTRTKCTCMTLVSFLLYTVT